MEPIFIIAQVVGVLTTVVAVATFQFKDVRHILLGNVISNLMVALQYALLGGFSGAWICMVAAVQTIVMYFLDKRENAQKLRKYLLVLFCVMYIVGTCIVYKNWEDILSCVCAMIYVLAILQTDSKNFRRCIFVNSSLWIVYDVCTMAYTGILTHGLELVSIITAMLRLDRKKD